MKNDHFFSIFSRFGLFRKVFGQVNEWTILKAWYDKSSTSSLVRNYFYFVFWSTLVERTAQSHEKWSNFEYFYPLWSFSPSFWEGWWVPYIRSAWNGNSATCSCVNNYSYLVLWSALAGGAAQTYEK